MANERILDGQVAIVTGGVRRLGRAMALTLQTDLPDGHYQLWARAITRSGFREGLAGRNRRAFVVR